MACVVGEAHGFKGVDDETGKHYKGCHKCNYFSFDIFVCKFGEYAKGMFTEEELNNDRDVKDFVEHFNEEHVK